MRKGLFFVFLSLQLPFFTNAQSVNDTSIRRQSLVFDHFINGKVLLKSGIVSEAPLNYLSADQSILFEKDGKIFTLTELSTIDTIYISGRKFVPFNNIVYEVISNSGEVALLLTYTNKLIPLVATADHNGSSKQAINTVSNTVSDVYLNKAYKGYYSVEVKRNFWLKSYNRISSAKRIKDFLNFFKESAQSSIKQFDRENHINFSMESDIIRLLNFCNSN